MKTELTRPKGEFGETVRAICVVLVTLFAGTFVMVLAAVGAFNLAVWLLGSGP